MTLSSIFFNQLFSAETTMYRQSHFSFVLPLKYSIVIENMYTKTTLKSRSLWQNFMNLEVDLSLYYLSECTEA